MPFTGLISLFQKSPYFNKVISELKEGKTDQFISGLWGGAKSLFIAALYELVCQPILVISQNEEEAEKLYEDLLIFLDKCEKSNLIFFPSAETESHLLALDKFTPADNRPIIITVPESLSLRLMSPANFLKLSQNITVGQTINRHDFIDKLVAGSYERLNLVESEGQFSVRGEIIDVWPPNLETPLRIEFLEDKIESLRQFDPLSQRKSNKLGKTHLIPFKDEAGDDNVSWLSYLSKETLAISDNVDVAEMLKKAKFRINQNLHLSSFGTPSAVSFHTRPMESFHRQIDFLARRIKEWLKDEYQVILFCDNEGQKERLKELIEPYLADFGDGIPLVTAGNISSGFLASELKIAIVTDEEIFGRYHWRRYLGKRKAREILSESIFFELNAGDYVVHESYGIGIHEGIQRLKIETYEQDFLVIGYDAGDKLYVPMDQLNLVQKYIGVEGYKPRLYRLGGVSWERVKKRVKESVQEMAKELIDLYAAREALEGYAFSQDSHWQKEFDSAFIYEETPDQSRAIEEVKKDMELTRPMDRIICGDVGYGKTEVAMRAAFKAVMDAKQVAMLVPTTILAEQHLNTFRERFADYPVSIEMLSRFRTKKEQHKIIADLQKGSIDIVIGTHRLIQKDVKLKDLGLVVIDEEQRFGVRHKEKLKQLRKLTDVLTLTATPIPRTLHMALSGIRNMSVINDPPEGRLPIATYVMEYDEKVIKEAILRELDRGGQVFFVHNRVKSINRVAEELTRIIPQAKIVVAHGQMPERELERVMLNFIAGEFDILVATTIIESGLDIPNVNTLIVKNVEDFGLAQLYQLRGRIGRGKHKAYAYLFYPPPQIEPLSEQAVKRLETIQEFTELGAGFKIAMRDLEIRGGGNLLGPEQSGYIMEVGFNLYCQLLSQAVDALRGKVISVPVITKINLDIPAFLPITYIDDDQSRVNIYKKMAGITETEELSDLKKELIDRFGEYPSEVALLLEIIEIRIIAQSLKILEIKQVANQINIELSRDTDLALEKLLKLADVKEYKNRISFEEGKNFVIIIKEIPRAHGDLLKFFKKILQKLI